MSNNYIPVRKIGVYLGYTINPSTAHRWRQKGVFHNGKWVKLAAKKIGSRYFVTKENLAAFIAELNTTPEELALTVNDVVPTSSEQADQILDQFNI